MVVDAPGQRLGTLAQQLGRGAAQDKEARRGARPVGQYAQHREEFRPALDLVQDHHPAQFAQRELGVGQLAQILGVLEVEAGYPAAARARQRAGERGLADLPRAEDRHHR